MIHTGDWPLSGQASIALQGACLRAALRVPPIASCEDLLRALIEVPGSEAAEAWSRLGAPPLEVPSGPASAGSRASEPVPPGEAMARVKASHMLQEVIEQAPNGTAITTGSLLLSLIRNDRFAAAAALRRWGITHTRVRRALETCVRESTAFEKEGATARDKHGAPRTGGTTA